MEVVLFEVSEPVAVGDSQTPGDRITNVFGGRRYIASMRHGTGLQDNVSLWKAGLQRERNAPIVVSVYDAVRFMTACVELST